MPRHLVQYDDKMRNTPEWSYLYALWQRMRRSGREKYFDKYHNFYKWAMEHGFKHGLNLRRIDDTKPWSRKNCEVVTPYNPRLLYGEEVRKRISDWNRAVNRIRVYYGMKPFPVEVEYDG